MVVEVADPNVLHECIARIATGPKLSKDLSRGQAAAGLSCILSGEAHPAQAAIFLVALRMKRESDDENLGMLDALLDASVRLVADVPTLIDISEPYDGFAKVMPVCAVLAPVLAACGVAALSHGVGQMPPKCGLTHRSVLTELGVDTDVTSNNALIAIEDSDVGWSYLDQSQFCPALYALSPLRALMVKRTALSTLERVMAPIRARNDTHLMAGYVHSAYPRIYAQLAFAAGFNTATLVRGVEGGVVPSLRQPGHAFITNSGNALSEVQLRPDELGIDHSERGVTATANCQNFSASAANTALAALRGEAGAARDALTYAGAIALWRSGRAETLTAGADTVRRVLDDGSALARLQAAAG